MPNLTALRLSVAKELGLDNTVAGDQPLIDEKLNQGVLEILLRTHCNVDATTISLSANTWQYQLATSILAIIDVARDDEPAERVDYAQIRNLRRAGGDTASDSIRTRYATLGSNLLLVWPTPSASQTLDIFYVPRPTALAAGADDPSAAANGRIPTEFHKLIELWAEAEMASYDDDGGSQHGDRYRFQFNEGIKEMRRRIQQKGGLRLSRARVNPQRRGRRPSDNSADVYWT